MNAGILGVPLDYNKTNLIAGNAKQEIAKRFEELGYFLCECPTTTLLAPTFRYALSRLKPKESQWIMKTFVRLGL